MQRRANVRATVDLNSDSEEAKTDRLVVPTSDNSPGRLVRQP